MSQNDAPKTKDSFTLGEGVPGEHGFTRLCVAGHLDADGAPRLAAALEEMLDRGKRRLELDLGAVGFISSTGIGTLIAATGEFKDAQGELLICNASTEIMNVFQTLDLFDYLSIR